MFLYEIKNILNRKKLITNKVYEKEILMNRFIINLNEMSKVKKFITIVNNYDCDIDVIKGRYIVDAKSIMGLFTMDLVNNIEVQIHSDNMDIIKKFQNDIKEYIVNA